MRYLSQPPRTSMSTMKLAGLVFLCIIAGADLTTITFKNNCMFPIWPAGLKGWGTDQLPTTGFKLLPQLEKSMEVVPPFSGRFWGRTHCSTVNSIFNCATGDCGSGDVACNGAGGVPPVSLVEFTLAAANGEDFFDVSLVDGFNLPVSVTPNGGDGVNCTVSYCDGDVNSVCPKEMAVEDPLGGETVIGCKSACEAFRQPQYCCTGDYGSPAACKPSNYSLIFKRECPQAYSYAYDDQSSTFTCSGNANYVITFCP